MTSSKFGRVTLGKLMGAASALVLASAGASFAQTQPADTSNGGIETVVVTAQFMQQNLQTTPLAVTALTSQDLEDRNINDLSQIGQTVPNLTLNKTPAAFGSGVQTYIRGVGQYDTAFASEPGVGMYIDDVYYGTLFGTVFDMLDLDRVEVDRGPQGVLGGKNSIGGSIRMFTKKAVGDGSGYLEATYGALNEINVRGAMDVTVIPDRLFMRVSGVSKQQDGYVRVMDFACEYPAQSGTLPALATRRGCSLGTQGGTDVRGARLALRGVITPHIEDNFTVNIIRDDSESQADTLLVSDSGGATVSVFRDGKVIDVPRTSFYSPNSDGVYQGSGGVGAWNFLYNQPHYGINWDGRFIPQANGETPYNTTFGTYTDQEGHRYTDGAMVHSWGLSNTIDWDILDNLHFKSITGFQVYHAANSNDSDVSPLSYQLTTSRPQNREFQQEGRFTGTLFNDKLDWTAGVIYYDRTSTQSGAVTLDGLYDLGLTFLVFQQNDRYISTHELAYVHGIYHITDDLEVFGGMRYTSERKTYYFDHHYSVPGYPGSGFFRVTVDPACTFGPDTPACPANSPLVPHTSRTEHPDFRGGVDYHVTDDIMTYFQFATGYRTGGTNSRPFAPDQLDSYGPEKLKSYEIGAKSDWFNHRLRANVAFFMSDYTNKITPLSLPDPGGAPVPYVKYVNLATEEDKGAEFEVTAAPIDNLLIDASYSILSQDQQPIPGAVPGYLDGCSADAFADGICGLVTAGTVKVGSHVILVPSTTAHLGAQYRISLGEAAGALTPRVDVQWQSTIYQGANNDPWTAIPARDTVDGRVTWEAPTGGWSLAVGVTNLTAEKYFYNVFDLSVFGQGSVEAQPAPPREWHIQLKKVF